MTRLCMSRVWMFPLLVLCLLGVSSPASARTVSLLVTAPKGTPAALKTAAELQWLMKELALPDLRSKNLHLFNYGHFSSPSRMASSKRWDKRARNTARQAAESYNSRSSDTSSMLFRAYNFFKFGQVYFLDKDSYRKNYFLMGLTMFRQKNYSQAKKYIYSGHLLEPTQSTLLGLNKQENNLLKAMRCHLAKAKAATLTVKSNSTDAVVELNGHTVGIGDVTVPNLRPGEYLLKVIRSGYRPWGKRVFLGAGQTKTVRAYIGRSPKARLFNSLCPRLLDSKDPEKLKDTFNFFAQRLVDSKREKTAKMFVGCFQGKGAGGKLHWYVLDKSNSAKPIREGTVRIPSSNSGRIKKLSSFLKMMGLNPTSFEPKKKLLYPSISESGSCPNLMSFKLEAPKPRVRIPAAPVSPWKDKVESGEQVAMTLNYGFSLQGKVLGYKGSKLWLQVVSKFQKPFLLRKVLVEHSELKSLIKLGSKTSNGYHLKERLLLVTVFGLMLEGTLVSDDGIRVTLKTARGNESLRWSDVKKVIRRDR